MKFLYIILIIIIALGFISCNDSLGIDPKVKIVSKEQDTSGNTPKPYVLDNIQANCMENYRFYQLGDNPVSINWKNYFKITDKRFELDTTKQDYVLRINSFHLNTLVPESAYSEFPITIKNKTISCEMKLNSLVLKEGALDSLKGDLGSNKYFALRIQSRIDSTITEYTGKDITVEYLVARFDKLNRYIILELRAYISENDSEVNDFELDLSINY